MVMGTDSTCSLGRITHEETSIQRKKRQNRERKPNAFQALNKEINLTLTLTTCTRCVYSKSVETPLILLTPYLTHQSSLRTVTRVDSKPLLALTCGSSDLFVFVLDNAFAFALLVFLVEFFNFDFDLW